LPIADPGSYVAHALMRAASRLVSMPVPGVMKTLAWHRHECRRGTPRGVRHTVIQHLHAMRSSSTIKPPRAVLITIAAGDKSAMVFPLPHG
jgi:hypothetical protein